jgi:hypothetical protein
MQPLHKQPPPVKILPALTGLRTDDDFDDYMFKHRKDKVRHDPISLLKA